MARNGIGLDDAQCRGACRNPRLPWGQFLTVGLSFLIVAWLLFLAIKAISTLKQEKPPAPAAEPTSEVKLLIEIRDLLQNR